MWYTWGEMDQVTIEGLWALAVLGVVFGLMPYGLIKLIDYEARQPAGSSDPASSNWFDPALRRN